VGRGGLGGCGSISCAQGLWQVRIGLLKQGSGKGAGYTVVEPWQFGGIHCCCLWGRKSKWSQGNRPPGLICGLGSGVRLGGRLSLHLIRSATTLYIFSRLSIAASGSPYGLDTVCIYLRIREDKALFTCTAFLNRYILYILLYIIISRYDSRHVLCRNTYMSEKCDGQLLTACQSL